MPSIDVKVMSSGGLKAVLGALAAGFERASRHRLALVFAPPAAVKRRVEDGEAADVVVLAANLIDDLIRQGRLAGETRIAVASSGMGVAVRKGAPKPDIGTTEAFRRALLGAQSIVFSDPAGGGASGVHFRKVIERLGIADAVMAKARLNSGSFNAELVARGEAELAIQQVSEILPVEGAELVGPLPPELQLTTRFAAAIGATAPEPAAARELLAFLASPEATSVIKANGMEPAS